MRAKPVFGDDPARKKIPGIGLAGGKNETDRRRPLLEDCRYVLILARIFLFGADILVCKFDIGSRKGFVVVPAGCCSQHEGQFFPVGGGFTGLGQNVNKIVFIDIISDKRLINEGEEPVAG